MTRLTYRDAVKILGAGSSPLVSALDRAFGGLLLGATPVLPDLLSVFDAKSELTRLADALVAKAIDKRHRLSQFDRIQRLHAARGVLVVRAYFDAVAKAELPFRLSEVRLSRKDEIGLAAGDFGGDFGAGSLADAANAILGADLPLVGVQFDGAGARRALEGFYSKLSEGFLDFIKGLRLWEELDATQQGQAVSALERITPTAVRSFEASMQELAADCPEFAIWLNLSGHRAIRDRLEDVHDAVRALVDRAAPVEQIAPALQGVVRFNRSVLTRKLVAVEELPEGLDAPEVGRAYIDPDFRMAEVNAQTPAHNEDFWSGIAVRRDFREFLLGYLSTPWAWSGPLVVLGHPGAGKSLLTEVQAARLPSPDFVCVRVPLRDVPADVDVHEQVEHAIRLSTHETVSWPDFARAAGGSLLVVLLDGFDELLQATGVSKSDYLLRVKRFQEVEATQGRHVAVVVTSRVTVADRMRFPGGTLAIRLEPFEISQVEQWVEVWNETNSDYLRSRYRRLFDLELIETYLELARQPLLLLMLAVYDAESGALRTGPERLSQTELYERLLHRFAYREVAKRNSRVEGDDSAVERELLVLSVVAFGMFNRGAQWITDAQLSADLAALGIAPPPQQAVTSGHHLLAGRAKDALGRFFFIHRARTTLEGVEFGTYEFLHATFGEYLVVRLTWRCLEDMVKRGRGEGLALSTNRRVNDAELRAFLSCALLSTRATTMDFLAELVSRMPPERLAETRGMLLTAFRAAHLPETDSTYSAYRPVASTPTARLATYSANLLLLIMTVSPELPVQELYADAGDHIDQWARTARLWQSQLRSSEWQSLTELYAVTRLGGRAEGPSIRLDHRTRSADRADHRTPLWTLQPPPDGTTAIEVPTRFFESAEFQCDPDVDLVANALGGRTGLFAALLPHHICEGGKPKSVTADLLDAFLFDVNQVPPEARMATYTRLITSIDLGHIGGPIEEDLASLIFQLLVNDDSVPASYVLEHTPSLYHAIEPPHGLRHLGLLLRLLIRTADHAPFLGVLDSLMELNELSLEQAAEVWCALADKGIPTEEYPAALRDRAYSLRWPEREEPLAHRPDLLKRLSELEDGELL